MAKKQYLSPELEINTLSCEDILTASVELTYHTFTDKYKGVIAPFNSDWLIN